MKNSLILAVHDFVFPSLSSVSDVGGIKDYSVSWTEAGVSSPPQTLNAPTIASSSLGNVAESVVDGVSATNGRRDAQIKVTVEDKAGWTSSQTYSLIIVAGDVAKSVSNTAVTSSKAGTNTIADGTEQWQYDVVLKDAL